MTTPAIHRSDVLDGNYRWDRSNIPDGQESWGYVSRYHTLIYETRPQSGSSPVREDGSRAPRAWEHSWGSYLAKPKRLSIEYYTSPTKRRKWEYKEGIPVGISIPAVPLDTCFHNIFVQVGLQWLSGGALATFPPSCEAAAVTRFRIKALSGVADLGTTLGELRMTANFVTDLCRGIESTVHRIADDLPRWYSPKRQLSRAEHRKQKAKQVAALLYGGRPGRRLAHETRSKYRRRIKAEKQILSDWLAYQFAVKPLVNDLVSASESLNYLLFEENLPLRATVKAGAEMKVQNQKVRTEVPHLEVSLNEDMRLDTLARCHYSGVFDMPLTSERTLRQLGLANPGSVAWELIQFSWLVDYAIGVGDWIKSMTSLDHMTWVEGSVSRICRLSNASGRVTVTGASSNVIVVKGEGACLFECGRFSRQVLSKAPMPAAFPVPKKQLGVRQMANALAALAGLADTRGLRI